MFLPRLSPRRRQIGKIARTLVAGLSLSAAGLVGIFVREGYTDRAVIPTKGDVPTKGFGSTFSESGKPVKLDERTNPVAAARLALSYIQSDEARLKSCMGDVKLNQTEYDIYVDLAYNIGTTNFCTGGRPGQTSTIIKRLRSEDYIGACDGILAWKYAGNYDCSTPGNTRCSGVWKDRLEKRAACLEAGR